MNQLYNTPKLVSVERISITENVEYPYAISPTIDNITVRIVDVPNRTYSSNTVEWSNIPASASTARVFIFGGETESISCGRNNFIYFNSPSAATLEIRKYSFTN